MNTKSFPAVIALNHIWWDIALNDTVTIILTGKGGKSRIVPVMKPTSELLKQYMEGSDLTSPVYERNPLFTNRGNKPLTRAGVTYILKKYAAQAQAMAQQAMLEKEATLTAISLGLDAKTIPYVLKMADLSQVSGQDGKVNDESLKNAINKVLEDVPALKPQPAGTTGFIQVGASGGSGQQTNSDDALKKAFGL